MKIILICITISCAYVIVALLIARFCGTNTRLEQELNGDDRSDSN